MPREREPLPDPLVIVTTEDVDGETVLLPQDDVVVRLITAWARRHRDPDTLRAAAATEDKADVAKMMRQVADMWEADSRARSRRRRGPIRSRKLQQTPRLTANVSVVFAIAHEQRI
jgi:hypothetical protein